MNLLRTISLLIIGFVLAACADDDDAERSYVNMSAAGGSGSPFSSAVMVDDTLYISGMLGRTASGELPDDPADEARAMLDRIQATLEDAGLTMDDLVYVTVYTTDLELYGVFNEVYRSYFTGPFPARAFIGAGTLLSGARFEMQSIAARD